MAAPHAVHCVEVSPSRRRTGAWHFGQGSTVVAILATDLLEAGCIPARKTARASSLRVGSLRTLSSTRRSPHPGSLALVLASVLLFSSLPARARDPIAHVVNGLASTPWIEASMDRATPRKALESFLSAAREGDFSAAAHCLDLHGAAIRPADPNSRKSSATSSTGARPSTSARCPTSQPLTTGKSWSTSSPSATRRSP